MAFLATFVIGRVSECNFFVSQIIVFAEFRVTQAFYSYCGKSDED